MSAMTFVHHGKAWKVICETAANVQGDVIVISGAHERDIGRHARPDLFINLRRNFAAPSRSTATTEQDAGDSAN